MQEDNLNKIEEVKIEKSAKKVILFVWELVKIAVIAFIIVAPIRYFLFQPFIVNGASMIPNFHSGDYLIVDEISYRFSSPQRGEVIVFDADFIEGHKNERFIKRIIGLPGETVNIKNGDVEIIKDGKVLVLDEDYLPDDLITIGETNTTLKINEYFVLGDNRGYSFDSRVWGAVDKDNIVGKAFLRVFPITSLSGVSRPSY